MLRTVDLRGATAASLTPAQLAGVLPRATLDVEAALDTVRPICADVRRRGAVAVREHTARFDGVDLPATRVPAGTRRRAGRAGPECPGRAGRVRPPARLVARGAAAGARRSPPSHRDRRSPSGTCRSPRPALLRPRRPDCLPVVGRDERDPGAGGGRRRDRRGVTAGPGARRAAASGRAGRLRAAGHHRGARRWRRAGGRHVAYGTADCAPADTVPAPATST